MPESVKERCMDCGGCVGVCPHDALDLFHAEIAALRSAISARRASAGAEGARPA